VAEALLYSLDHWTAGPGLEQLLGNVDQAVTQAVRLEESLHQTIREVILTRLATLPNAPAGAKVYRVDATTLRSIVRQKLLAGQVTACGSANAGHDGMAAMVATVGVSLVRYDGTLNSWKNSFYRTHYQTKQSDPVAMLKSVLEHQGNNDPRAAPGVFRSTLLRRGYTACAERQALAERAETPWRLGRGIPAPVELIANSGCPELLAYALPMLRRFFLEQDRWVYLPESTANQTLQTVANALNPGELAILQRANAMIYPILETAHVHASQREELDRFAQRFAEQVVIGGFRATPSSPAQLFIAPASRALEAGLIAMADASLSPVRGYPLLLQLAQQGAKTGLGIESFGGILEVAYARCRKPVFGVDCGPEF
jgi:hypothetical protein